MSEEPTSTSPEVAETEDKMEVDEQGGPAVGAEPAETSDVVLSPEPELNADSSEVSKGEPSATNDAELDDGEKLAVVEKPNSSLRSARRRSEVTPTVPMRRSMPSRVKGRGMAYLLAMEKGGGKKRLAKAEAQVNAQDAALNAPTQGEEADNDQSPRFDAPSESENPLSSESSVQTPARSVATPASKGRSASFPKKSHPLVDISSPLYREPFKHGWRREVVFRAITDSSAKTLCDVYYYAPSGKKLRSTREVLSYLEKTGSSLSVEHFTYFKEPLGAEPENEILRHAKRKDEAVERRTPKVEKTPKPQENEAVRKDMEELDKDVAAITGSLPEEPPVAPEAKTPQEEEASKSPPSKRKARSEKAEKQMKVRLFNRRSRGPRSKENAEPLISAKEDLLPCSRECPKAEGQWPSQTCQKCFSLFHPACVGGENPTECLRCRPQSTVPAESTPVASPTKDSPTDVKSSPKPEAKTVESASESAESAVAAPAETTPLAKPKVQRKPRQSAASKTPGSRQNADLVNGKRPSDSSPVTSSATADSSESRKTESEALSPPAKQARLSVQAAQSSSPASEIIRRFFGGSAGQFINYIGLGYHGLLHVFKYLTVQELMTASRVCKLWRDLAFHHSHWVSVRLKNSRIYNWPSFTAHLRRTGTRHLDLRKMLFVTSQEETWQNVQQASANLSELVHIDLCKCPASVLEHVARHSLQLQTIDAQSISSSTVHLAPLSNLTQLQDLKLRGTSSLSVADGYQHLSSLTKLKSLSLTTLSNLSAGDLKFLAKLVNLETLELGDCDRLSESSAFQVFSSLPKLRYVRLERGPSSAAGLDMLHPLCRLPQLSHLELVNFEMMSNAIDFFTGLSSLKRILIIPRYTADTVQSTVEYLFTVLPLMREVQQLCWVFTEPLVSSIREGRVNLQLPGLSSEPFALESLQDLLKEKMPRTHVRMIQLPEYSAQRFSLSQNSED